jgi:predicted O-methyltransferase YrrM
MTKLHEFFDNVAGRLATSADSLKQFAAEDTIGGFHANPQERKWEVGAIWEVEGKALYALVRALEPNYIVEFGSMNGCSTTHILSALAKNGHGILYSVDNAAYNKFDAPKDLSPYHKIFFMDYQEFLSDILPDITPDMVFEDLLHSPVQVREIWQQAGTRLQAGGVMISHDAAHYLVGEQVTQGIRDAGVTDYSVHLIEPSDCGFALWVKPGKPTVVKEAATIGEVIEGTLEQTEEPVQFASDHIPEISYSDNAEWEYIEDDAGETVEFGGHPLIEYAEDHSYQVDDDEPESDIVDMIEGMTKAVLIDYARDNEIAVITQSRISDFIDTILEADE